MNNIYSYIALIVFVLAGFINQAKAQYITLPDPNFAGFISSTYPGLINGGNQLDTNASKLITGTFDARNKNLTNVTGIQYFDNVTKLFLSRNQLTSLPPLNRLDKLTFLWLDTNRLTTVPNIQMMANLREFKCRNNKITSLPSLDGLADLRVFFCDNNLLTALPSMNGLTSLEHFICSDNFISALPDMSSHIALRRFLCTNNKFTEVDLTMLPSLKEVHFKYNLLKKFPRINGLTQLTELLLFGNFIDSLPDLSPYTNLTDFNIADNRLTFEDLNALATHPNVLSFELTPQKKVGTLTNSILKVGNSFQFHLPIDSNLTTNRYSWYKNNILIATTNTNTFSISSLRIENNGVYSCRVQTTIVPLDTLTLYSYTTTLQVIRCMDLSSLKPLYYSSSCVYPIKAGVSEELIYGATPPYHYTLRNVILNTTEQYTQPNFSFPLAGSYDLLVSDATGCTEVFSNFFSFQRSPECDPIFYPDLSGAESSYYIEEKGTAKIYNPAGTKIREIQTPGYWDGRNQSGTMMESGLYVIIINEQIKIQVSLMRSN